MNPVAIIVVAAVIEGALLYLGFFEVLPALGWQPPGWLIATVYGGWGVYEVTTFRPKAMALGQPTRFGPDSVKGRTGMALSDIGPTGKVKIGREIWRARVDGDTILCGSTVTVQHRDGLVLVVERSKESEEAASRKQATH